jgi:mono/diheme cytochrome c family protein
MGMRRRTRVAASAAVLLTFAVVGASEPRTRGGGGGAQGGLGTQTPAVQQISRSPAVDSASHDRGRALWASHCIECHGSQARGSETGPNIIRTKTVNFDRSSFTPGSVLGPFLRAGHPTQSGKASASFTDDEIVSLAHFLRQRVNDTMRSSPLFTAADILVGDAKAGESYFNGAGGCATCHNATTRSLTGIRGRVTTTVDLQQRMLFPASGRGRGASAADNPYAVTVTVTPLAGPALSGVLVERSDFYVTFRQADGTIRVVPTTGATVVTTNPLQAHIDLLDRISDKQIHDVVAYLENLR